MDHKIGAVLSMTDRNFTSTVDKAINSSRRLSTSTKSSNRNLSRMRKEFKEAGSGANSFTKKIVGVVGAYAGFRTLGSVVKNALDGASALEGYRNTLNVVMKDQEKAAKTMQWATDFANKTPFETDSVVEATVKLESYGLAASKVLPIVGDMAGVMNKDIIQAVEAVADAQTGKENLPPMLAIA